jgi:hypothetical protein
MPPQVLIDILCTVTAMQEYGQVVGENVAVVKTERLDPLSQTTVNKLWEAAVVEKFVTKIKTGKGCDFFK